MADEIHWVARALIEDTIEAVGLAATLFSSGIAAGAWFWSRRARPGPGKKAVVSKSLEDALSALADGKSVWVRKSDDGFAKPKLVKHGGIPIITVANLKGGVGKTTITSNLAAFLSANGKKCLVIDLDYQGSLSAAMITASNKTPEFEKAGRAQTFLDPESSIEQLVKSTIDLNPTFNVDLAPAYYDLQSAEELLMLNWLATKGGPDLRYSLCTHLQSGYFQHRYAAILIDAPPRMTTGFINALSASTHLFIPTILDRMSAEAATFLAKQVSEMMTSHFPNLDLGGIIPSRTSGLTNDRLSEREELEADFIDIEIEKIWRRPSAVLRKAKIPNGEPFASVAGSDIAYLGNSRDARARIEAMGQTVCDVIGLKL